MHLLEENISNFVKPIPDGSSRIQEAELFLNEPTVLVNVYTPSRGTKTLKSSYIEVLDELGVIHENVCNTHQILLFGDLKAENNGKRDVMLKYHRWHRSTEDIIDEEKLSPRVLAKGTGQGMCLNDK